MEYVYGFLGYDMGRQLSLVVYSLILGAILGIIFDVLRISRVLLTYRGNGGRIRRVSDTFLSAIAFIEDIFFASVSAALLILFCFKVNRGISRSFLLFGAAVGFILYYFTVGRLTSLASNAISRAIYALFAFLTKRCVFPIIRFIKKIFKKIFDATLGKLGRRLLAKIRELRTKKVSRDLHAAIARLYIENNRKDDGDETNSNTHAGKDHDLHGVYYNGNHPRRNSNRI